MEFIWEAIILNCLVHPVWSSCLFVISKVRKLKVANITDYIDYSFDLRSVIFKAPDYR